MNNRIIQHTMNIVDTGLTLISQRYGALSQPQLTLVTEIVKDIERILLIYTDIHTTGNLGLALNLYSMMQPVCQRVVRLEQCSNLNREQAIYFEQMRDNCERLARLIDNYVHEVSEEIYV